MVNCLDAKYIMNGENCTYPFCFRWSRRILLLVLLLVNRSFGQTEDQSRYLLPEDFRPFDVEEFHKALQDGSVWEMVKLRPAIRLGDLSQRSAWGGTQRDFKVDLRPSLLIQYVSKDRSKEMEPKTLRMDFSQSGITIGGGYLGGTTWEDGRTFKHPTTRSMFRDIDLPDGSGLTFFAPLVRWPEKQGASLVCVRPKYSKLVYKKRGNLPEKVYGSYSTIFQALTFDFSYELEAEYVSGTVPAKGAISVFVDPIFYDKPIGFDEVFVRNPIVEIYGELEGKMKPARLAGKEMVRAQVVSKASFSLGSRRGVFLRHDVYEVWPAPEILPWVAQQMISRDLYAAPFDNFGQCAYLVRYSVEREIYEKLQEESVDTSDSEADAKLEGKSAIGDLMS